MTRPFFAFLKKHNGLLLLFLFSVIGLVIFTDYGISWDEPYCNDLGNVNYNYVFSGDKTLLTHMDRDYGIAFELPLVMIEKALGLEDSRGIYLTRHICIHLFFLIGAFCCFKLIDFLYANKLLAAIGFLLIVLHPLLYAHSFFNSKDVPFMSMFMIGLYINAVAFEKQKMKYFILLGIVSGLLINMRIAGILLPGSILLFMLFDLFVNRKNIASVKKSILLIIVFFFTTTITLYVSWPFLWDAPWANFTQTFKAMSKFRWEGTVLFNGQMTDATKLPWYYLPVWFAITTPVLYLLTGIFGILSFIFIFLKRPFDFLQNTKKRNNVFFAITLFTPVLAAIILRSVLYDGWRHMYFIYPSFVLLGIFGLNFIFSKKLKIPVLVCLSISFVSTGYFMIQAHPFEHIYFNRTVDTKTPEYMRSQYELDYWGTAYKQSLEYLLKEDHSNTINIAVATHPGVFNLSILTAEQRKRIHLTGKEDATYFITDYRQHPSDYYEYKGMEWYSVKVNNNKINTIFKLK